MINGSSLRVDYWTRKRRVLFLDLQKLSNFGHNVNGNFLQHLVEQLLLSHLENPLFYAILKESLEPPETGQKISWNATNKFERTALNPTCKIDFWEVW